MCRRACSSIGRPTLAWLNADDVGQQRVGQHGGHRRTEQQQQWHVDCGSEKAFQRMMSIAGGGVDLGVAVVHRVQAPQPGHGMRQAVQHVRGAVEHGEGQHPLNPRWRADARKQFN